MNTPQDIASQMGDPNKVIPRGTTIEEFLSALPPNTLEALLALPFDASKGTQQATIPEIGTVRYWIDECSEGADRGGYVPYVEFEHIHDSNGNKIRLEAETDQSTFYFDGRMTILM